MEISNEIMLGLIAALMGLIKIIEAVVKKIGARNGGGHKTLTHEEHDWLKTIAENHDVRNPQSILNQMEECKKLNQEILKITESNRRTHDDIWEYLQKLRRK